MTVDSNELAVLLSHTSVTEADIGACWIWPVLSIRPETGYTDWDSDGFPQGLQANAGTPPEMRTQSRLFQLI